MIVLSSLVEALGKGIQRQKKNLIKSKILFFPSICSTAQGSGRCIPQVASNSLSSWSSQTHFQSPCPKFEIVHPFPSLLRPAQWRGINVSANKVTNVALDLEPDRKSTAPLPQSQQQQENTTVHLTFKRIIRSRFQD